MDQGNVNNWEGLVYGFELLGEYKDSKERLNKCEEKVKTIVEAERLAKIEEENRKKEKKYQAATEAKAKGDIEYASMLFMELGDYKDASKNANELKELNIKKKVEANIARQKKRKKITAILVAIVFIVIAAYVISSFLRWDFDNEGRWHSVFGMRNGASEHSMILVEDVPPTS